VDCSECAFLICWYKKEEICYVGSNEGRNNILITSTGLRRQSRFCIVYDKNRFAIKDKFTDFHLCYKSSIYVNLYRHCSCITLAEHSVFCICKCSRKKRYNDIYKKVKNIKLDFSSCDSAEIALYCIQERDTFLWKGYLLYGEVN